MPNSDTIHTSPELLSLIAECDEFKGAWRALGALAPERLNALSYAPRSSRARVNAQRRCSSSRIGVRMACVSPC